MPSRRRKPFIDRKTASTFRLMHRSQRDVAPDLLENDNDNNDNVTGAPMILWPSPGNNPEINQLVMGMANAVASKNADADANSSNNKQQQQLADTTSSNGQKMLEWKQRLTQAGLLEDDPNKYLKPLSGNGTFLFANGQVSHNLHGIDIVDDETQDPENALLEISRQQFDAIPLRPECIVDQEIKAALFDDDFFDNADGFEELTDDFVLQATQEPEHYDIDDNDVPSAAFDFDEHIRQMIAKAQSEENNSNSSDVNTRLAHDAQFFNNLQPLRTIHDGNDDEYNEHDECNNVDGDSWGASQAGTLTTVAGVVPALDPDQERALCEKFAATLAEYDTDEDEEDYDDFDPAAKQQFVVNDGSDDNDSAHDNIVDGASSIAVQSQSQPQPQNLITDAQLEAALDDFLLEKQDDILMQGPPRSKRTGGSGYTAFINGRLVPAKDIDNALAIDNATTNTTTTIQDVNIMLNEAKERLDEPTMQPGPMEDVLIDGKSYFSERVRNPWDCESILSTYSNMDNRPAVIDSSNSVVRRRGGKKKQQQQQIVLSKKTGLPIMPGNKSESSNSNEDDDNDSLITDTLQSVNRGAARSKQESKAEKKARKAAIKQEKQMSRLQKKMARIIWEEEWQKHQGTASANSANVDNDVAGKTVFRYS